MRAEHGTGEQGDNLFLDFSNFFGYGLGTAIMAAIPITSHSPPPSSLPSIYKYYGDPFYPARSAAPPLGQLGH